MFLIKFKKITDIFINEYQSFKNNTNNQKKINLDFSLHNYKEIDSN